MKNIVVGIDFSENSINSLRHAVALATVTGATVHIVWVKTPGAARGLGKGSIEDFTKIAQSKLDDMIQRCKAEAPNVQTISVILEGKPSLELPKYASNQPESMVVVGAHGISGSEDRSIGSNAFKVISESGVPVFILREGVQVNKDLINVLVPIDTSFETLQKMRIAISFAKAFSAKIILLGIYPPNNAQDKHVVSVQLSHANRMCAGANVRHETDVLEVSSRISKSIIDYALAHDVNLMTVMKEEETDLTDFWVGSTLRQLMNTTPIPLLVIPNKNHFSVNK